MPTGVKAGTTTVRSLLTNGVQRQYRLHLPPSFTNANRVPLVLNFHGRTATASEQESYSGLIPVSDREGFALVSPDGMGSPRAWSAGATPPGPIDDVRFTSDLLDTLERELCIDATRVYATGFSNGAFLASRLACEMPDRITAAAAVGGIHYPSAACAGQVPILAIHGAADDVVPIAGGMIRQMRYAGAYDAIARWAASNGCAAEFDAQWLGEGVSRLVYRDCPVSTSLVVLQGVGHLWPGSVLLPEQLRTGLNAAEMIWSFFSLQSM